MVIAKSLIMDHMDHMETACVMVGNANKQHTKNLLLMPYLETKLMLINYENIPDSLHHDGEDCWNDCKYHQGKCDWCGPDGWCCREGWIGNGCTGTIGGSFNHQCVLNYFGNIHTF